MNRMKADPKDWKIRLATVEDAAGLEACMHAAYRDYEPRMNGQVLPPMILDYAAEIRDIPTWVLEFESVIVGGLSMRFEVDTAILANIAVSPEFQGQGAGRGLMDFAQNQARNKGFKEMRLATHVLLSETISLYAHLGWAEYDRDESRVYFKKVISI